MNASPAIVKPRAHDGEKRELIARRRIRSRDNPRQSAANRERQDSNNNAEDKSIAKRAKIGR